MAGPSVIGGSTAVGFGFTRAIDVRCQCHYQLDFLFRINFVDTKPEYFKFDIRHERE